MNILKIVIVKQQKELRSKQWGIYVDGVLVEGGFFDKGLAELTAEQYK